MGLVNVDIYTITQFPISNKIKAIQNGIELRVTI